jgi:hypothetical protein
VILTRPFAPKRLFDAIYEHSNTLSIAAGFPNHPRIEHDGVRAQSRSDGPLDNRAPDHYVAHKLFSSIFLSLTLHCWRIRIFDLEPKRA